MFSVSSLHYRSTVLRGVLALSNSLLLPFPENQTSFAALPATRLSLSHRPRLPPSSVFHSVPKMLVNPLPGSRHYIKHYGGYKNKKHTESVLWNLLAGRAQRTLNKRQKALNMGVLCKRSLLSRRGSQRHDSEPWVCQVRLGTSGEERGLPTPAWGVTRTCRLPAVAWGTGRPLYLLNWGWGQWQQPPPVSPALQVISCSWERHLKRLEEVQLVALGLCHEPQDRSPRNRFLDDIVEDKWQPKQFVPNCWGNRETWTVFEQGNDIIRSVI